MNKVQVTIHYLDNGLVEYTGTDVYFNTKINCFIIDQEDSRQIIIPLTSIRCIKTPKPSWSVKGS